MLFEPIDSSLFKTLVASHGTTSWFSQERTAREDKVEREAKGNTSDPLLVYILASCFAILRVCSFWEKMLRKSETEKSRDVNWTTRIITIRRLDFRRIRDLRIFVKGEAPSLLFWTKGYITLRDPKPCLKASNLSSLTLKPSCLSYKVDTQRSCY